MSTQPQQSRQRRALAQRRAELEMWRTKGHVKGQVRNKLSVEDKIDACEQDIAHLEEKVL